VGSHAGVPRGSSGHFGWLPALEHCPVLASSGAGRSRAVRKRRVLRPVEQGAQTRQRHSALLPRAPRSRAAAGQFRLACRGFGLPDRARCIFLPARPFAIRHERHQFAVRLLAPAHAVVVEIRFTHVAEQVRAAGLEVIRRDFALRAAARRRSPRWPKSGTAAVISRAVRRLTRATAEAPGCKHPLDMGASSAPAGQRARPPSRARLSRMARARILCKAVRSTHASLSVESAGSEVRARGARPRAWMLRGDDERLRAASERGGLALARVMGKTCVENLPIAGEQPP